MKSKFLTIAILFLFVLQAIGQEEENSVANPYNVSCRSAEKLCSAEHEETFSQNFDFNGTTNCVNGKSKLYYSFKAVQTSSNSIFSYSTPGTTSTFKVYGPFSSLDNSCDQIEQLIAPVLVQTNTSTLNQTISGSFVVNKFYLIEIIINSCSGTISGNVPTRLMSCIDEIPCENCIGSFQPPEGQYIISAWTKETGSNIQGVTTYQNSQIIVEAGNGPIIFSPTGQIIDGWQQVEGVFTANSIGEIQIELKSLAGTSYFDDIRIFPYDGSMISYVYDPITLRLMAELDERNYAKLYEYDEEGKLIRLKKETEKGIMTIQENRNNTSGQ